MAAIAQAEDKFQLPGWRIEQKYRPGVLIGNWSEQRCDFERQNVKSGSTQRTDFVHPGTVVPETTTRRRMMMSNEGLSKNMLFTHHGRRHKTVPRAWDRHRLAWLPEASDHPVLGETTKWGLLDSLVDKWKKQEKLEKLGDFTTTYCLGYNQKPSSSTYPSTRHASPRKLSSHFHPNNTNKDLPLRDTIHTTSIKPEHPVEDTLKTFSTQTSQTE